MLKKVCELSDLKLLDEGTGSFTGYASRFGIFDRVNEATTKGAFAWDLDTFRTDGFIAVGHAWNELGVATIGEAREDEEGLYVKGDFHSTVAAQEARTWVKERMARKKSVGLSIGYDVLQAENTPKGRLLRKIKLYEVSIVAVPALPEAQAISAKDGGRGDEKSVIGAANLPLADRARTWDSSAAEKRVRAWADAGDSPNAKYRRAFMILEGEADQFTSYKFGFGDVIDGELKAVPRALFAIAGILQGARGGANLSAEDRDGAKAKCAAYYSRMRREFDDPSLVVPWDESAGKSASMPYMEPAMAMAAMVEAHQHLMNALYNGIDNGLGAHEVEPAFDEHKEACLAVYKALCQKPAMKAAALELFTIPGADPPAGPAETQLQSLLADAEAFAARQGEIAALRAKGGRSLSQERRGQLAELAKRFWALALVAEPKSLSPEAADALLSHYRDRRGRRTPVTP